MMSFGALIDHIGRVCALEPADAYKVAEPVWANRAPDAHEVEPPDDESLRELARSLGLEVAGDNSPERQQLTMDPEVVLAEVYRHTPWVLCSKMPVAGHVPEKARELLPPEVLEQIPEEAQAGLVSVNVMEGTAVFTFCDVANEIDREIGPIDLSRFESGAEMKHAMDVLLGRLGRVLAAPFN